MNGLNADQQVALHEALRQLLESAAGVNGADVERAALVKLWQHLLTPAVCRRLGIFTWPPGFLLSVVIPVFNEERTVRTLVERVLRVGMPCELIVVNDGSVDGTGEVLLQLQREHGIKILHHRFNRGKGAAIRTGLAAVQGDAVVIQDADLEYDPNDIPLLLGPLIEDRADVVYGSRFSSNDRPVARYWHHTGNRAVTWLSNMFTNLKLTDVETCYKVIRRRPMEAIRDQLREEGFGIELEITARLARLNDVRFYELPVSYSPRGYAEGKKIGWRDGLRAIWCVLRYSLGR